MTTTAVKPPGKDVPEAVVSLYRKHEKLHPRAVSGWFSAWRWALVWATQVLFYGLPWLPWNGRQALLFDLEARRFFIFDLVLYPQDFIYLTGLLVISAYTLFLFTAVAGRVWCGFACPQTVYTEIFIWVEKQFEGDRVQRLKLDAAPWGWNKLLRKSGKQGTWLAIGLWTGFTFVGYFTPIRSLWAEALQFNWSGWETFWVLFYGFATYGNAGWMREQVCKYMCPYARFQSAMFDKDTLIISYDPERGEPRGRRLSADHSTRGHSTAVAAKPVGDCIDCGLCVQVCPTGIDIRQGLQYECIGCAACVDVCNNVMDKMQYPRGLIRYDTQRGMGQHLSPAQKLKHIWRPRVLAYGAVLLLISAGLLASLVMRTTFKVDVVRDRGSLGRVVEDGFVENVYRVQVMNATEQAQTFRISATGLPGLSAETRGDLVRLESAQASWVPVSLRLSPEAAGRAGAGSHPVTLVVERLPGAAGQGADTLQTGSTFIVPR